MIHTLCLFSCPKPSKSLYYGFCRFNSFVLMPLFYSHPFPILYFGHHCQRLVDCICIPHNYFPENFHLLLFAVPGFMALSLLFYFHWSLIITLLQSVQWFSFFHLISGSCKVASWAKLPFLSKQVQSDHHIWLLVHIEEGRLSGENYFRILCYKHFN